MVGQNSSASSAMTRSTKDASRNGSDISSLRADLKTDRLSSEENEEDECIYVHYDAVHDAALSAQARAMKDVDKMTSTNQREEKDSSKMKSTTQVNGANSQVTSKGASRPSIKVPTVNIDKSIPLYELPLDKAALDKAVLSLSTITNLKTNTCVVSSVPTFRRNIVEEAVSAPTINPHTDIDPGTDTSHFDIEAQKKTSRKSPFLGRKESSFFEQYKELPCKGTARQVRMYHRTKIQPFWKIIIAQLVCVIYILVLTFSHPPVGIRDPVSNNIIDPNSETNTNNGVIYVNGSYRPVVAIGGWQKFCLAISRMSAFSLYPMMVVVFVSKMKALQTFLAKTPLSMYFGVIKESHDYHAHAGKYIAFDVWVHTVFHLIRWASQGNISLLWTSAAGLSGLITIVATPLITFPMMYCKDKISYEVRKGLHYLFYVFAVAMCFHVPTTAIPNGGFIAPILGTCIVLYTLDALYVYLVMSEKIETTAFHVLSSGVRISMPVSDSFQKRGEKGDFAYICIPWIDDKQWHPFSLFEDPDDPSVKQMFLMKTGDWTTDVHKALSRDTTRPCWIQGPFPSPYSHASLYDNQILVASGIGITPALAAISAFKDSRRVNLIWAVRDPEMLGFFLEHMYLDHDGWNLIFYTGKKPLAPELEKSNTNVKVIRGRPKLDSVIPNVIYGIESKEGLPEKYTERSKSEMKDLLTQRILKLDTDQTMTATEKVAKLREFGEILGFSLQEFINGIEPINKSPGSMMSSCISDALVVDEQNAADFMREIKTTVTGKSSMSPRRQSSQSGASCDSISISFIDDLLGDIDDQLSQGAEEEIHEQLIPPDRPDRRDVFRRTGSNLCWNRLSVVMNKKDTDTDKMLMPAFHPWVEDETQERCVKRLSEDIMSSWGIMYCGGSEPVIKALRGISHDYNLDLHIDSFKW